MDLRYEIIKRVQQKVDFDLIERLKIVIQASSNNDKQVQSILYLIEDELDKIVRSLQDDVNCCISAYLTELSLEKKGGGYSEKDCPF